MLKFKFTSLIAAIFIITHLTAVTTDLQVGDVKQIMSQIFEKQGENKGLTDQVVRNSFKIYIEQFDPYKTYLLEEEVAPYLNMSNARVAEIISQYQKNDLEAYITLNNLIQKSILRARTIRAQINPDELIGIKPVELKISPEVPYPKNETELKNRIRTQMADFINSEKRRFGSAYVQQNKDRLMQIYTTNADDFENQYFNVAAVTTVVATEQDDDQFLIHVLKSLSRSLDAHTSYLDDSEATDMRVRLNKGFNGTGLILQDRARKIVVSGFTPNGPASKNPSIHVGDQIMEINGATTSKMDINQVRDSLEGEKGTNVSLVLKRPNQTSPYRVTLTRDTIIINEGRAEVSYESFGNGIIGIIKLDSFYRGPNGISSESDVKKAIQDLDSKGNLRGLVLDLRENTGGFLSEAVKVAGLFITNGVVVISKYNNGEEKFYRDMDSSVTFDGPLIILTSKATASAAEIVAQALQDYGVAVIVGDEQTYGKGTIQTQTVTREDGKGSYFKVTVGKYYTVSGKTPQIQGVKADVVVPGKFSAMELGEEYLDIPHDTNNQQIAAAFSDSLRDINPSLKSWYLHYYMPTIQKPRADWTQVMNQLKDNSKYRLDHNSNYQLFIKQLKGDNATDAAVSDDDDDYGRGNNATYGREDLQKQEAVNILKDMIYLQPRAETVQR
jgi:carboxyl-terminal processing protease